MKKILAVILLIVTYQISAQEQTLISGNITHGGYGGPEVKFTQIGDEFGLLVGGKGGWIINHTYVIGGGGYGLVNNIRTDKLLSDRKTYLNFGYGGVILEYIQDSDQLIHYSFSALIGAGGVGYRIENGAEWSNEDTKSFFVAEPAANAEFNLTTFFRINAGVSYRFLSSIEFDRFNQNDLGGVSANITFKFGKF